MVGGVGASTTSLTAQRTFKWVDQQVSFIAGGIVIDGTLRHPAGDAADVPGVLLIAGSGPTDRNGNSPLENGAVDTLKTLADWLSADGVASLRYDKLGSGSTGIGPYAADPASIGIGPFEQESQAALTFLARQKGIDDRRLAVFGHSEGALFALLLATGHAGVGPHISALGLFEPLSLRYLDLIRVQVEADVASLLARGAISGAIARRVDEKLVAAIAELRATGHVPSGLPFGLGSILNPSTSRFLSEADRYDPATLAAALPAGIPVLVSCSNVDRQVSCAEVDHLIGGLTKADAATDFVHLNGVDHVLKVDPTGSPSNYTAALPFSPQLESALRRFVSKYLF